MCVALVVYRRRPFPQRLVRLPPPTTFTTRDSFSVYIYIYYTLPRLPLLQYLTSTTRYYVHVYALHRRYGRRPCPWLPRDIDSGSESGNPHNLSRFNLTTRQFPFHRRTTHRVQHIIIIVAFTTLPGVRRFPPVVSIVFADFRHRKHCKLAVTL